MKTILISGVAGFIGSHLAHYFLKQHCRVLGFDNFSNPYATKYYQNNLKLVNTFPEFYFKKIDLLETKSLNKFIGKTRIDYLIHTAAKTGIAESFRQREEYFRVNVEGTVSLVNLVSSLNNICRIIIFSSSSVYGKQDKLPITEKALLLPLSPYGESKKQMEKELARIAYQNKLNITIVRPFSVYGPRGRRNMAPYLLYQAIKSNQPFFIFGNNQTNQRDWTYIDDLVNGVVQIVKKKINGFAVFNLGAGSPIGIEAFVKQAVNFFPDKSKVKILKKPCRVYEANITWADINKALKSFGFRPKTQFKQGILKTFKAFGHEED